MQTMQLRTRQPSISGTNKISSYGTQSWYQLNQVRNKTSTDYQQPEKCGQKSAAYSQPKLTRLNNNSSPVSSVTNTIQVYSKSQNIPIDTKFKQIFLSIPNTGKDIRHHINTLINDANRLREMGSPLQNKYMVNRMLPTLPESFRHVRSQWPNVPTNEKTVENLIPRLIAEEGVGASYTVQTPIPPTNSHTNSGAFKGTTTG